MSEACCPLLYASFGRNILQNMSVTVKNIHTLDVAIRTKENLYCMGIAILIELVCKECYIILHLCLSRIAFASEIS